MADNVIIVVNDTIDNVVIEVDQNVGATGLSAYQIAVGHGFVGTEAQWLDSLQAKIVVGVTPPPSPAVNDLWVDTN